MSKLFLCRLRRLSASGSPILLTMALAMIAVAMNVFSRSYHSVLPMTQDIVISRPPQWPWVIVLILLVLLAVQWYFEFRRRTHDPTWALKLDDKFNSDSMKVVRARAARELKDNIDNLNDDNLVLPCVDEVLSFFEDIAFYMNGDQISPEVAHHAFQHWIRGYYLITQDYIACAQKGSSTSWEYLDDLFETLENVEKSKDKGKRKKTPASKARLMEFLDGEMLLTNRN